MTVRPITLAVACLVLLAMLHRTAAEEPSEVKSGVAGAVSQAIPYLWQEGENWIQKRGCVSCHQVPAMLWSLSAAQRRGFDVDPDRLRAHQVWATQAVNFVKPEQKSDLDVSATLASNIDTMNALLLAIEPASFEPTCADWRQQFAQALVANQQADGSWKACGQLPAQKRPPVETTQVTTIWTLLSLARNEADPDDHSAALQEIENPAPESTEWWVASILLADQTGQAEVNQFRSKLWQRQNDDGGWGWLSVDASDALATGMALYALRQTATDVEAEAKALSSAEQFLIDTQQSDGSWSVPGTKKSSRSRSTPTSDYWGTAWAVIGMLEGS